MQLSSPADEVGKHPHRDHDVMAWLTTLRARPVASGLLTAVLLLSGCGGNNSTPVCSDVDSLKSSVSALTSVKLQQGALPELKSKLAAVQQDFSQLKTDAKSQFSSQVDAVDSAYASFKSSLDAAIANPSATTVSAVGATLTPLKNSLTDLETAVDNSC